MPKDKLTIKDLNACPHCDGHSGYYQRIKSKVNYHDNTTWKGAKENTEMMDSQVFTFESKYYYCMDCNKRICKAN